MIDEATERKLIVLREVMPSLGGLAIAAYTVTAEGESVEMELWGTCSPYAKTVDDNRDVGDALRPAVLKCCRLNCDKVLPPHSRFIEDSNGKRPWSVVIGSGAARHSGIAIAAAVLCTDEHDAMTKMSKMQEVFR